MFIVDCSIMGFDVHVCESSRRVDWSQASKQWSASRAGMKKQHCMQLRANKARPTSLLQREVSLFSQDVP